MKSRKRLGSENVMKIDGFADGNAISDPNSEFRRKQAGNYLGEPWETLGKEPRANQEGTKKEHQEESRKRLSAENVMKINGFR